MSGSVSDSWLVDFLNGEFERYNTPKLRWQLIGITVILILWEIAGHLMGSFFLAPISEIIPVYYRELTTGNLVDVAVNSLRQMFIGFAIASGIGIPLGLVMGQSTKLEKMIDPWVSAFFVTSTAALIPFFIIIFGIGFEFRVAIVWMSAQWHILIEMFEGSKEIKGGYSTLADSFGASPLQTYTKILLPGIVPYTMVALRLGLGRSIKGMVLAEMFVVIGFGGYLIQAQQYQSTATLLSGILTIMLVAVIFTGVLKQIGKLVAPWYDF